MSNYRDYGYDDYGGGSGGSQRWDRDRFERISRARGPRNSGSFQYEEDDRYYGGGDERKIRVDIEQDRRGGYARGENYYNDERYSNPRRSSRPEYVEDDRFQVSSRELEPYRRDYDRDYEAPVRRSQRPSYVRRQSSLDTHDRRPIPRYGEQDREITVNLNMQSPTRQNREYDYGSPRQDYYPEEDYRDVSIRRERERSTYRRWDDQDDQYEEPPPSRLSYQNKRGRTRMPKRLVHRNAILQMGYPFEEQEDFYIVRTALGKDQIDEVIKISESYFRESSTSIRVDESRMIAAPEPEGEPEQTEVIETTTTKVIENPTEEDIARYGQGGEGGRSGSSDTTENQSQYFSKETAKNIRSPSPSRGPSRGRSTSQVYEEESFSSTNQNQIILPERRKERDIKAEIKALEAERRALREGRQSREKSEVTEKSRDDYEVVENSKDRDVVYVEKDSRGRLSLVRSAHQ